MSDTNLSPSELTDLGLASVGENVRIDRRVALFGAPWISIGSNVRIDAHSVITASATGSVSIGSHTHLSAGVTVLGAAAGVTIGAYCAFAPHVSIFSAVEDYTGGAIATPMVPIEFRDPEVGHVEIGDHVIVGTSSVVVVPGGIHRGAAVGALSLVDRQVPEGTVAMGMPLRFIGRRDQDKLAEFQGRFEAGDYSSGDSSTT